MRSTWEKSKARHLAPGPHLAEGQEFTADSPGVAPVEEFCAWAWANIHKEIVAIMSGGSLTPWVNQTGVAIACCKDGFRLVVFKIEGIE